MYKIFTLSGNSGETVALSEPPPKNMHKQFQLKMKLSLIMRLPVTPAYLWVMQVGGFSEDQR